jgi:hypothetical protein
MCRVAQRFEAPDELRTFPRGRFELVRLAGRVFGRATYQPGWRWSVDVGAPLGQSFCELEHLGLVLAGRATVAYPDGRVLVLETGQLFHVPKKPHDSWVVGGEPYVSLHFLGAEDYAR